MASSPPEISESQPEYASPDHEPRLLTRQVHHTQTLQGLRTRIARPPNRFKRIIRRAAYLFAAIVILIGLGLVTLALFLRHDLRASLPQLDGDLHSAGLTAPVTITRDQQGVPNIQAATLSDLLFAQGFVTAQDRLWQMDSLRRHAAGELAEVMGSSLLDHDRQQRTLQLRAAADRAVLTLPSDQLAQLQAYSRGVNAFLESSADRLPVEFHLLHYKPAPWTPRDSLLVAIAMFQDLGTSFPSSSAVRRSPNTSHLKSSPISIPHILSAISRPPSRAKTSRPPSPKYFRSPSTTRR